MALIDVSTKKHQNTFAIVDDSDFEWLSQWDWHVFENHGHLRVCRSIGGQKGYVQMHREIMGLKKGDGRQCDHKNGNSLDNQRLNLRECNSQQNKANSAKGRGKSKYKGVIVSGSKFRARIVVNYRLLHIGYFDAEDAAGRAYDTAAKQHFGEFARLNFP